MNILKHFLYTLLLISSTVHADRLEVEKVSVQLEWKHQFEFAGFYAALDQGYYGEVNLDRCSSKSIPVLSLLSVTFLPVYQRESFRRRN